MCRTESLSPLSRSSQSKLVTTSESSRKQLAALLVEYADVAVSPTSRSVTVEVLT